MALQRPPEMFARESSVHHFSAISRLQRRSREFGDTSNRRVNRKKRVQLMKNGSKKKSVALIFLLSVLPCGVHQLLERSAQNVQISDLVSGVAQNDTAIKRKII